MRLLSKKEVRDKVGFSFAHLARLENQPEYAHLGFPKRVPIGFRVFWVDEEIEDFIRRMIAVRDAIARS
jgi:predicted DNA-binding transcriptional regulator AlpA